MTQDQTSNPSTPPEPTKPEAAEPVRLPWLPWTQMRLLGNIHFLKVSYLVLAGVPLLALIQHQISSRWQVFQNMPLLMQLTYFSSLLLSIAHMLYQGYCPQIIKRFDSPNDLYRDLLQIKALQAQYLPGDRAFAFDIEHCRRGFAANNLKYWLARLLCAVFYVGGAALFVGVMTLQALRVVGVFV